MSDTPTRRFPMSQPDGHVPAIQRYSAQFDPSTQHIQTMYLGVQSHGGSWADLTAALPGIQRLFALPDGPVHHDYARFVDPQGALTLFGVAYWTDPEAHDRWTRTSEVTAFWQDPAKRSGSLGYFCESLAASKDHAETIAFKEYIRGLSACPRHSVAAMNESGYWGAARDRIPASGYDELSGSVDNFACVTRSDTLGHDIQITAPRNLCLIRSGVSWADCGPEQLGSYNTNIKPKLDLGMDHLRQNPRDTGCLSLRQVDVVDTFGHPQPEGYSAGLFLSLKHLETWALEHPTHLAIYHRAQMERQKYKDALELRTYHEVYVLNRASTFRYLNCHGATGLLAIQFASPLH